MSDTKFEIPASINLRYRLPPSQQEDFGKVVTVSFHPIKWDPALGYAAPLNF